MGKDLIDTLSYSSFFWSLGTTSFRTKEFNYSIERQLDLLERFWQIPENSNQGWEKKYMAPGQADIYEIKNRYYDFMRDNGFTTGDDKVKYKAAREKTSGLVDLGLINENHRLTEVGRRILAISRSNGYQSDNPLLISKDSHVYLRQLLKTSVKTDGVIVRPFVVLLYLLSRLDYLTYEEFTFLAPLCTSSEITEQMVDNIKKVRHGEKAINDIIVEVIMSKQNYQHAYEVLMTNEATEDVIMRIGLNRKSRNYDKPYYPLYLMLREVYLYGRYEKAFHLFKLTNAVSNVGRIWRKLLFDTPSVVAVKKEPRKHLNPTMFDEVSTEDDFKTAFFKTLHLVKNLATLGDYFDLNRRYLNIANVILFEDGQVKLDLVPKQFFASAIDELYQSAYTPSDLLEQDCTMEQICPSLHFNEQQVTESLSNELGIELNSIDEAYAEVDKQRYERFNHLLAAKFTDEKLLQLLTDFDERRDEEINQMVTDNADVPTIFEYVLAIIWYKVSGKRGKILDYMKLSLDANLLPITHAAGGEADIVYEYSETSDYPKHTVLLEATLADSTNQRRMEMEPVSRHLGNHILRTKNKTSYCLFATNDLNVNVISDFRNRKVMTYYDTKDPRQYITGMKIIPLQISDLRSIIIAQKNYPELYTKYEAAYQKDMSVLPWPWYLSYVREKTSFKSFSEAPEVADYADQLMDAFGGISILTLQKECIEKFGEEYSLMKQGDWYHAVRDYVEARTNRYDLKHDEQVYWMAAEDASWERT